MFSRQGLHVQSSLYVQSPFSINLFKQVRVSVFMQAIIRIDDVGFVTHWSPEAEELFGFEADEVMDWSLNTFIHSIERMDVDKRRKLMLDNILDDVDEGSEVEFTTVNLRSDLRAFLNNIVIRPHPDGGTVGIATRLDDTQMIREYNALVEMEGHKALAVTTYEGKILGANKSFAMMARTNRMNLLNRQMGTLEGAMYYDLADFEGFMGLLVAMEFTPTSKEEMVQLPCGMNVPR